MSRIYTRTGDAGDTALFDGTRVSKSDPRMDACGDLDELGSWLGMVRATCTEADVLATLEDVQRDLFAIGALIADPQRRIAVRLEKVAIDEAAVARLEAGIDRLERELPPLRRFILAGGAPAGAMLHVARSVCRRAERRVVALGAAAVHPLILTYINRLSDLLFTLARAVNRRSGVAETEW